MAASGFFFVVMQEDILKSSRSESSPNKISEKLGVNMFRILGIPVIPALVSST